MGIALLALPVLLLVQVALSLGAGLFLAVVNTFVRDVSQILPVILQFVMLATPVLYTIEVMPPAMQRLTRLSPLYYVIDGYRRVFVYASWPDWAGLVYAASVSAILLLGGLSVFRRAKGYFEAVV